MSSVHADVLATLLPPLAAPESDGIMAHGVEEVLPGAVTSGGSYTISGGSYTISAASGVCTCTWTTIGNFSSSTPWSYTYL